MQFNSMEYTVLELFVKPHGEGRVTLYSNEEEIIAYEEILPQRYAAWIRFPLEKTKDYILKTENAKIHLSYLSGNDRPLQDGVTYLDPQGNLAGSADLETRYNVPNREQYHFTPFTGWLNDPNGLCKWRGYYHLFYQFNPFGQQWDNMYWGHAASADLVHWVNLPVALAPQEEILNDRDKKGGAFSGSAVPMEDRIQFFLTRHADMGGAPTEFQTAAYSTDGVNLQGEHAILPVQGSPVGTDCRDPKAAYEDGQWSMVLGSRWDGVPAILRYLSMDGESWELQGPVLTEAEEGIYTVECPDLFPLSGKWVAVAGLMRHKDAFGRLQGTRYYIGEQRDGKLAVESAGLYDFGGNFYAVQSFWDGERRIAIGWLSDFYGEHLPGEKNAYGSMSIPRELSVREGKLWMRPIKEIYTLRGKTLYQGAGENVHLEKANENCYMARVELKDESDFLILLAQNGNSSLSLRRLNGVTEFVTKGVASEGVRFPAQVERLFAVEIFMDRRVCEVFLNDGEAAGAKLFYTGVDGGVFYADFTAPEAVESLSVYEMKTCW